MGDGQRVEERERLALAAFQIERKGRSGAGAMALVDVRLPRPFLEKAEVADRLDFRMAAEEFADPGGVLTGAIHPELERLEAAQQHPRGVRVEDRADGVPQH